MIHRSSYNLHLEHCSLALGHRPHPILQQDGDRIDTGTTASSTSRQAQRCRLGFSTFCVTLKKLSGPLTITDEPLLAAKNKLKQDAQAIKATRKPANFVNTTPHQPSSSRNAASGVQAAAKDLKDTPAPLPRDSRLGKYFEYDLSKLHNSKGGFLTEEDGDARQTMAAIQREKARERARIAAGEEPGQSCHLPADSSGCTRVLTTLARLVTSDILCLQQPSIQRRRRDAPSVAAWS